MLQHSFTAEQILFTYDELKHQDFWSDKFLSMRSVQKQIGEIYRKGVINAARTPRFHPSQAYPAHHRTTDAERLAGAMGADTDVSDL
jgi:hypothetical protein